MFRCCFIPLFCLVLLNTAPRVQADVDPIHARALHDLKRFTDWLQSNDAKGFIGEVGWPDDRHKEADKWNALAEEWFQEADQHQLWVAVWATGEWWQGYPLAIYRKIIPPKTGSGDSPSPTPAPDGVNNPNSQAPVLEAHLGNAKVLRGVSVAGADFGTPGNGAFSNRHLGTIDRGYHYDGAATFKFLAERGIKLVRIPFRWERLQPDLNEELDVAELKRLKDCVAAAEDSGLTVILDMHNYAEYWLFDGAKGVRRTIGSMELPDLALADVWRRISRAFADHPRVFYGLMNEPHDIESVEGLSGARIWERASQKTLDAIRESGDHKTVLVSGYGWSGARSWPDNHPHAWIIDPANNFRYEAHQYFDRDNSGTYRATYAKELEMIEHPELVK